MSTYQEQIERAAALKKTKVIEGIFEDIRAGKYFGADALSKAFDAGVASCVVTEARHIQRWTLDQFADGDQMARQMTTTVDGEWVRFEDVQSLVSPLAARACSICGAQMKRLRNETGDEYLSCTSGGHTEEFHP